MGGERPLTIDIADYILSKARASEDDHYVIVIDILSHHFGVSKEFIRDRKDMILLSLNLEEDILDAFYNYFEAYDIEGFEILFIEKRRNGHAVPV